MPWHGRRCLFKGCMSLGIAAICSVNSRHMLWCLFAAGHTSPWCCVASAMQSEDKTLRLLNDFWHVLTKEEGNEKLLRECLDWMQQRTPQV